MSKLFFSLLLLSCQKKQESFSPRLTSFSKASSSPISRDQVASEDKDFPKPDEETFFPLIEGSYWAYETVQDGQRQEGSRYVDSVVSLTKTDSGFIARVQRKSSDGLLLEIIYHIDSLGTVWKKNGPNPAFQAFASLHPIIGSKLKSLTFYPCSGSNTEDSDCVLLQPYIGDQEKLSEEEYMNWNGRFFQRGVGLESMAGVEISDDLMEHRIGKSKKIIVPTGSLKE